METASPVREKYQMINGSSAKLNTSGQKHELASELAVGSNAQDSQTEANPNPKQNMLVATNEMGSEQVSNEAMEAKFVESAAGSTYETMLSSTLKESIPAEGIEIGSELMIDQTLDISSPKASNERREAEPMQIHEKPQMGSKEDLNDTRDTRTIESGGEDTYQTMQSSTMKESIPGEEHENASELMSGETKNGQGIDILSKKAGNECSEAESVEETLEKNEMGSTECLNKSKEMRIKSNVLDTCQTMQSSILKENIPQEEHEIGFEVTKGETNNDQNMDILSPKEVDNAYGEAEPVGNDEKDEMGSKQGLNEIMDTWMILSDAEANCQTMQSSVVKESISGEEHEIGLQHTERVSETSHGIDILIPKEVDKGRVEAEPMEIVEKNETGTEQVLNVTMETRAGGCEDTCHTAQNAILKESIPGEEHEIGSNLARSETKTDKSMDVLSSKEVGNECGEAEPMETGERNETESKQVLNETVETRIIGSDAEDTCQTIHSSVLKESILGEHEICFELRQTETKNAQTMHMSNPKEVGNEHGETEPMKASIFGSDADVGELLATPDVNTTKNSDGSARKDKKASSRSLKRKYVLRSSGGSDRVLRSRDTKPANPSATAVNINDDRERKRKKRKKTKKAMVNEFSRTRQRLRYLLTRMGYEHNLIEAYSGEGWKGQSSEKIKPEKELQRANSEILRCKRRIRDLFEHLNSLCMEGKLQDSLFDSEGEIDSEDIFCAKCGLKDVSTDNDIILCDGVCDRGFHQMCLEPPLPREEIPTDEEGWLCPGCDCKVDCINLLNDNQGMDVSVNDSWEKVFPEAATTAAGDLLDENLGLPSDDSEDDDYDPDALEVVERVQTDGSSSESSEDSEESDFSSASDDSVIPPHEDQYMGLPSDDSEDNDYDPSAPDLEHDKTTESSSSDFTSDSEYFSASSDGDEASGTKVPISLIDGSESLLKKNKKKPESSELLPSVDPNLSLGSSSPVSGKRQRERLDYKKLHDEEYGNDPSDSSDDEDWFEADTSSKGDGTEKDLSLLPKGISRTKKGRKNAKVAEKNARETRKTPNSRRPQQKLNPEVANISAAETPKASPEAKHSGKRSTASARSLGDNVTEKLYAAFKEKEYPTRETKDALAEELGLTVRQVSKWFDNCRWSSRHPSGRANKTPLTNAKLPEPVLNVASEDVAGSGVKDQELCKGNNPKRQGKPRKNKVDHGISEEMSMIKETLTTDGLTDSATKQKLRRSGRKTNQESPTQSQSQTRSRKSTT